MKAQEILERKVRSPGLDLLDEMIDGGDRLGGCWNWPYARNAQGYGLITTGPKGSARTVLVHRAAFAMAHDEWPAVCRHRCDNPSCFNPAHLVDGTRAENTRDMVERARTVKPQAKLTAVEVAEIRRLWADEKLSSLQIGRLYGVSYHTVGSVLRGDTWKDVAGPVRRLGRGAPKARVRAECGTNRGYYAHLRYGEQVDNGCREAHNKYAGQFRAAKRKAS